MTARVAIPIGLAIAAVLSGCATYRTKLTNAQGQTTTCEASGKNGIVSGYYLRKGFEDCIDRAHAAGYSEAPPMQASSTK